MSFSKSVLSNGVRVVTEFHSHSNAVATGLWIETGTRDEHDNEAGLSHFLEHMVFKGTKKRNTYTIARELEAVGGDLNAFTTQEYTCFHATTLKDDFNLQIDVLCDLVKNATFDSAELKREKGVVLQEIAMTVDQPEEHLFDIFFDQVYGDHKLGRPILGTADVVSKFTRKDVLNYYNRRYANKNIIVSCAGGVDHEKVVQLVDKQLGTLKRRLDVRKRTKPKFLPIRTVVPRETEQVQILVGTPASHFKSEDRFEGFILNSLLGGGMTSKLYQTIREKRGLAYSVYSQLTSFVDTGVSSVYAGTEPKNVNTVLGLITQEFARLRKRKVSESDLKLFKTQVRGAILLGADDIENRMNSLGVNEMIFGQYRSVERVIEDIEKVSAKSLKQYVDEHLHEDQLAILVMGGVDENKTQDFINKL